MNHLFLGILICIGILIGDAGFAVSPKNPFKINFEKKSELTHADFIEVQRLLGQINIHPVLHPLWQDKETYSHYGNFWLQCSSGLRQELINPQKGFYPKQELTQIGIGGDRCIVCYSPYRILEEDPGLKAQHIGEIAQALSQIGFNGHFLSLIGGFPNPTGEEIRYAGVPHSYKIFMMLQAHKLGFTNVLWINPTCLPLKDPTPLFEEIQTQEIVLHMQPISSDLKKYIFENTRSILQKTTGTDVCNSNHVVATVFGLKMNSEKVQRFLQQYYALVDLGTPFLSCLPEEFVLSAIIGRPEFRDWNRSISMDRLFMKIGPKNLDSEAAIQNAQKAGFFFYEKQH